MDRKEPKRNWLELPVEIWGMILHKIGAIEILTSAQFVCSSWHKICNNPQMWRIINTHNYGTSLVYKDRYLEALCRHAVDLSCGQLVDINIEYFGTDHLLQYITRSSNQLRRLVIVNCNEVSDEGLTEAVLKLPLLEYLELLSSSFDAETLKAIGRCCPLLKSLKLNRNVFWGPIFANDEEALAIAETMPNLRHLEMISNVLTNEGLQAILDGCPALETLDIRECLNIDDSDGQLEQECAQRIKNVRKGSKHYTSSEHYRSQYTSDIFLYSFIQATTKSTIFKTKP